MIATLLLTLGGNVTVSLPTEAHVSGLEFTLGEIAQVVGEDPALAERVRSFALGYAPAPGYSRLIESAALLRETRESFPGVELVFGGAENCRVHAKVQLIEAAAIGALAKAELAQVFRDQDAELAMQGQLLDLAVPVGDTPPRLQARLRELTPRSGSWSVPVDVVVDGSVARTIWTSWNVELWEEREVLVRDVPRGNPLSPKDLERRRVRVQQHEMSEAIDKAALRGATTRRDMRAGETVHLTDVEREIVIRRGDMVHLEVRKGAIIARGAAVAQEDARVGDRVRIVMTSTRYELVAVVASKERVEIVMN